MFDLTPLDTALSILEHFKNLFESDKQTKEVDSVATRFVRLFEKHGINSNQIPRFFGHGLTLADVANHEKLLEKLTHEILQSACGLFAVRLQWLEGADEKIYETHDFYKRPEEYAEFLARLIVEDKYRTIAKLVLSSDPAWKQDALLVLEEQFDYLDDEPLVRYHLCTGWVHKYWKSRADLTACIAMTLKQYVYIKKRRTTSSIEAFCAGKGFMADLYDLPSAFDRDRLFRRRFQISHPDCWIYDPTAFVDGVAEGNFGKASALERWLYYFDKGYMETGYHRNNAREEFATLLKKYK